MGIDNHSLFEAYLNQHDDGAWEQVVRSLLPHTHEVDKAATQIWFKFFPLALLRAIQLSEDPSTLTAKLQLAGRYYLKDQIDSSHEFLYGHRYWPQVKAAVAALAQSNRAPSSLDLATLIRDMAGRVAAHNKADPSLLIGITAAGFMTLQQVGAEALQKSPGKTGAVRDQSPEQILKQRAQNDRQGLFGFLKGANKEWTVTFNENDREARFKLIHSQEITSAAANDKRDYRSCDPRCGDGAGPIPVHCRSAACGTCWVGVLGGAEKMSEVTPRERQRIRKFGYIDTDESRPFIRLACQAQAMGAVSIVIPPWNGVIGSYVRREKSGGGERQKIR